jgi:hypothetical protein
VEIAAQLRSSHLAKLVQWKVGRPALDVQFGERLEQRTRRCAKREIRDRTGRRLQRNRPTVQNVLDLSPEARIHRRRLSLAQTEIRMEEQKRIPVSVAFLVKNVAVKTTETLDYVRKCAGRPLEHRIEGVHA